MKINKTYLFLINYNAVASAYLKKNINIDNKLCNAIKNFNKQLQIKFDEFNEEKENIELNNCAVDNDGIILKDQHNQKRFTIDGEKKYKKELKKLFDTTTEIHSRIIDNCDDLIKQLTEEEKEYFSEIIIPKQIIE